MNISKIAGRASRLITDNSPVILTALGVAGVATTAYLTGRAAFETKAVLDAHDDMNAIARPRTNRVTFELVWKLYVPAVSTGVMTCTCIVLANRIGTRRAAVVAAAYTLSERAFSEYRDQILETLGDKKEELIRSEIHKKNLEKIKPSETTVIVTDGGETLIMEAYTNRVFKGDKELIRKAENDTNAQILGHDYASVSDFYDRINLEHTAISDEMGWNTSDRMVLEWSTTEYEGRPVLVFDYGIRPFLRPWQMV